jgi:hypothetical protein
MKRSDIKWYELLKDFAGSLIAVVAVGIGLWQYGVTSKRDFIQPLRTAQLDRYQEASSAAARLATLARGSDGWTKSREEFLRLYYGPLAIFEDFDHRDDKEGKLTVELAMIIFKSCMDDEEKCQANGGSLVDLSLALAHTCRESLGVSWGYDLPQLRGDYQQRAINYWKRRNGEAT